ncbi:MAG: hypothetical protein B9S32_03940 [Verrucomicrobia bacterium Tous-C9LFEB]|nr:MAG: hypothetical protein B9S32_03940 [Verrucomicrobia bacterium Tous-C9LFEB]
MKILAIQLHQPGDTILTTPALRWWINAGCEVHVLAQPVSAQLLNTMPGLAGIYSMRRQTIQVARDFRRWRQLSKMDFDWAVAFSHCSERPSLWAYLSGAPKRTAVVLKKFPHLLRRTGWINEWRQHPAWAQHTVEQHLALAGARPGESVHYDLEYRPSDEARQWHSKWRKQKGLLWGEYIHFHLTSRLMEKCWPSEHARKFIQLSRQLSLPLVVTTGPELFERLYADDVLRGLNQDVISLTATDPHQLGALIEGARVFVGMDSMPMHLAAALNVPGLALFGPSDSRLWGPWHSRLKIIQAEGPFSEMESIAPSAVFQALEDCLERSTTLR